MKQRQIFLTLAWAALLLTGCGDKGAVPGTAGPGTVSVITIEGNDRMRFSPDRFAVKAGETIQLTLKNAGTMPKETMGHNLVIIEAGVSPIAFATVAVRPRASRPAATSAAWSIRATSQPPGMSP